MEASIIESDQPVGQGMAGIPSDPSKSLSSDSVRVLVVTRRQDRAELINSILRNGGIPFHYRRVDEADGASEALGLGFDLCVVFADENPDVLRSVLDARDRAVPDLPIISCRPELDPDQLSADVIAGASDLVSHNQRQRLLRVFRRELRAARMGRALREAVTTASSYREQLQTFMAGSADAISHVQEGVILDTNPAWNQLFGFEDDTELLGTPIMDLFAEESHATLKGALVACAQARWPGDPLRCAGVDRVGTRLDVELNLETVQSEGEACIRISIVPTSRDDTLLLQELRDAVNKDSVTGLFTRQYLLESLQDRIREPLRGGLRALAIVRPDAFANIVESVGSVASEEVLGGLARILKEHVQSNDIYGRFGGTLFAALISRGNIGDLKAWGESFCRKASSQLFELGEKSVSVSCTVGIAVVDGKDADIDETVSLAMHACANGRLKGGDRVSMSSADKESTEIEENDRLWVPRIKQALIEKRFRLAHQPIACLAGTGEGFYDVLVRMVDEQGDEVLPGQFMAAAERNQLVKNIDRWVMGAAISWLAEGKASRVFARVSQPSIGDDTLIRWLLEQLESEKLTPEKLVLQVPEIVAEKHLKATRDLAEEARSLGFGFAIEHFGLGARPAQVLSHVPMEFLKIDGSLMQGMSTEAHLQTKVADLVAEARDKGISTIAERVEDANTMAVLWQLGVEYIQGYQVREPEVVLEEERPLG